MTYHNWMFLAGVVFVALIVWFINWADERYMRDADEWASTLRNLERNCRPLRDEDVRHG